MAEGLKINCFNMAFLEFQNYKILGVSTSVPRNVRKTSDLKETFGEEITTKIEKHVGVIQGHLCDEKTTASDLCVDAALNLINEIKINKEDIDGLIFVSQTPDYIAPSTACLIQHRLGLKNDCLAFDINLACSAYVYGLTAALSYLQQQSHMRNILLLCGDTVSKHCSPLDRQLALLSYDAGTATLIGKERNNHIAKFHVKTIGSGYRSLIVPFGGYRHRNGELERAEREPGIIRNDYDGYMNGPDVFRFSIKEVPKLVNEFDNKFSLDLDKIDIHFMHQANKFIIGNISKRVNFPSNKVPISIKNYGNTGAATIPLTICNHYAPEKRAVVYEKISLCGFGIGLSLGFGVLNLENTLILPIKICDEENIFDDNISNLHNETKQMVE